MIWFWFVEKQPGLRMIAKLTPSVEPRTIECVIIMNSSIVVAKRLRKGLINRHYIIATL